MAYNYQKRSTTAAPFPPCILWDGFMLTNGCTKNCNREAVSLGRTVTARSSAPFFVGAAVLTDVLWREISHKNLINIFVSFMRSKGTAYNDTSTPVTPTYSSLMIYTK